MNGIFITLEGGDGAGKTTQARLLTDWLTERGHVVAQTREPGGTQLGQELRNLLLHTTDEIDPRAEALLYAADRAQHVAEVVRPALARGEVVVQDRYIDSSIAYQGAGRVLDEAEIQSLSEWATGNLWPELTVLLDVTPETAVARRSADGRGADRLEREPHEFHREVRAGFLQLAAANPSRYLVIDAGLDADTIHASVVARVEALLEARSGR